MCIRDSILTSVLIRIANPRSAILQKALSPLPYERFVGFASMQSLWAFNFGHPCPSLVKGELLLLSFVQPTIEGLPHRTLSSPQPLQKDNNPSPHVCPFIQYVNHSPVCSPAHSSAFGTASPQDRCKAPK